MRMLRGVVSLSHPTPSHPTPPHLAPPHFPSLESTRKRGVGLLLFPTQSNNRRVVSDTFSPFLAVLFICVPHKVADLQKSIAAAVGRLKQQQNLYEAVRSDRNVYSKNLIETQASVVYFLIPSSSHFPVTAICAPGICCLISFNVMFTHLTRACWGVSARMHVCVCACYISVPAGRDQGDEAAF